MSQQVTNAGMWCCIVSRRHGEAISTKPFFALKTMARSKKESLAKYNKLLETDSELRSLTLERCSKITIKEQMR